MGEALTGLKRSCMCCDVNESMIGQEVTVMGWVQRRRDLGQLIFIALRDKTGLVQIAIDGNTAEKDLFAKAETVRSEYVLAVKGLVAAREDGNINPNMKTGKIEIIAKELRILSESETTPFQIEDNITVKDDLRLKYRYLDLRRPSQLKNLVLRHKVVQVMRNFLDKEGFLEIETPVLGKSTPEGARDYLVPSRVHPGNFYGLPQSPQLYKQLLMVSGMDRYYQVAKCFRDEDLRADRQPEFTQIDMELSFVDIDDVIEEIDVLMLLRVQHERHDGNESFSKEGYNSQFGLTEARYKRLKDTAIVMHPAPVNRDVEIDDSLVEAPKARIVRQMTNGVFVRMAILEAVLNGKA